MASRSRVDVRLAWLVGGLAALLNALLVAGFAVFAISEGLEEEAARLDDALRHADAASADAHRRAWSEVTVWTALRAGPDDVLVRGNREATGALPLAHFTEERAELVSLAVIVILAGAIASIGFGIFAARRALAPVRALSAAMRAIEPTRLAERVPDRETGDDIDALAGAINAVLARLEWSFGRLEAFGADAAHELRSPINRVLNESQLALLDGDGAQHASALAAIHETAEQMTQLVNQLLLLASGEEGRLRLEREPLALDAALAALVDLYVPLAESLGKSIELDASPAATWSCDRRLVERALANLIENALVHAEAGAKVRVVAADDRIGVLDSGPGIAEADRARAFDRFVRLDAARHGRGSGLGLPIARMIARLHGGDVWIEASPLGGAAVWMHVPPA